MPRIAVSVILFAVLTAVGLLVLEFRVGLQLYHPIPSGPSPVATVRRLPAEPGVDGTSILEITRCLPGGKPPGTPVSIPVQTGRLTFRFDSIHWGGPLRWLGFVDRVKLAQAIVAAPKDAQALDVNGGRDPCWELAKLFGPLTFGALRAKEWMRPVVSLPPRETKRILFDPEKGPLLEP